MRKLSLAAFFLLFFTIIHAQDTLNERLLEAVKHNRLDSVKILVAQGADVNYTDSNKAPVLMWAAYKADLKMVKYLVLKGADFTKKGIIPFEDGSYYGNLTGIAAGEGKLNILKFFIEDCKIDVNDKEIDPEGLVQEDAKTAIYYSDVFGGNYSITKYLIKEGAYYNLHENLFVGGDIKLLKIYLSIHPDEIDKQNSDGQTTLIRIIRERNFTKPSRFISKSTNLNLQDIYGNTALHHAVLMHKINWVKILINKGADLNIKNSEGKTPIFYSLDYKNEKALNYFLNKQADIDISDSDGKHLIFYAIEQNNLKYIDSYLDHGISLELKDPEGRTPLLYSLYVLKPQLGNYFIDQGANINTGNNLAETPYQISCRRNYYSIIKKMRNLNVDTLMPKTIPVRLKIPLGNPGPIYSIDISSNNKYILAISKNSIHLYDINDQKEIRTLAKQNLFYKSAVLSPNDSLICSFSDDKIFLWDAYNGEFIKEIDISKVLMGRGKKPLSKYFGYEISTLAFLDNKSILFGYSQISRTYSDYDSVCFDVGAIFLLDIYNERILEKLKSHNGYVNSIEISSDSRYLLAAINNNSLIVYNVNDYSIAMRVSFENCRLVGIQFSSDNKYVISLTSDSLIRYYEILSKKLAKTQFSPGIIYDFAQSLDGKYIALNSRESLQLRVKEFSGIKLKEIIMNENQWSKFEFTTDSKYLVFNDESKIKFIDINNDFIIKELASKKIQLSTINKTYDDKLIAIGSKKYQPILWNLESGNLTKACSQDNHPIQDLVFLENDSKFITAGYTEYDSNFCRKPLFLKWDSKSSNILDTVFYSADALSDQFVCMTVHDSTFFLSYTIRTSGKYRDESGKLDVIDEKGYNTILENNEFKERICALSVSHNGDYILSGGGENIFLIREDGTGFGKNELLLINSYSGKIIKSFSDQKSSTFSVCFSPDDQTFASASQDNSIVLYDIQSGDIIRTFCDPAQFEMNSVCFSPDGKYILSGSSNAYVSLWDVESGKLVRTFLGHQGPVKKVLFSKDGKLVFSASEDNTIKIWNVEEGTNLATLIPLPDGEWVVTNPVGLFDASPGAMKMIYYVAGMETIDLDQLKQRYYQPGLLQILLGYKDEPLRDVQGLNEIELYPSSKLQIRDNKLDITLENRGGGIGQVSLYLDDIEIIHEIRPDPFNPDTSNITLTVDLAEYERYFNYDTTNVIGVITWNEEGYLRSRKDTVHFRPKEAGKLRGWEAGKLSGGEAGKLGGGEAGGHGAMERGWENPRLYAVVAGIADYQGTKIDLRFAGKDAAEFAYALKLGAENYFGPGNVFINLFTTDSTQSYYQPTKSNIIDAFARCADSAGPGDYLVVYLAGHGITYGGPDGDFYYLAQDAYDTDSKIFMDPVIRESVTISAEELTAMIDSITARKKVLILDVCAAGNAAEQIFAGVRDVPGNVTRVLDNMQDRTGIYILAGCEANASSYETTVYGQGLLAYSLLSAMRGSALKMDAGEEYVDVNTLLQYARDQVPRLSAGSMQRQTPFIKVPENDMGYYIGMMRPEDKMKIELSLPKPVFMASNFNMEEKLYDELDLKSITDKKLNEITSRGKDAELVFTDALFLPNSYSLSGIYKVSGENITLNLVILYNHKPVSSPVTLTGNVNELGEFAQNIINRAYREIQNIAK